MKIKELRKVAKEMGEDAITKEIRKQIKRLRKDGCNVRVADLAEELLAEADVRADQQRIKENENG